MLQRNQKTRQQKHLFQAAWKKFWKVAPQTFVMRKLRALRRLGKVEAP
jgi:hypothetical protein